MLNMDHLATHKQLNKNEPAEQKGHAEYHDNSRGEMLTAFSMLCHLSTVTHI